MKFASAITLSAHLMENAPKSIVDYFLQILKDPISLNQEYKPVSLRSYDAVDEIAIHLPLISTGRQPQVVSQLLEAMNRYSPINAAMLAHSTLIVASGRQPPVAGTSFEQLNALQQEVILVIVDSDFVWKRRGMTSETLKFFNLLYRRSELRKYCHQP